MAGIKSVHECLFCSQTFDCAATKDDHVLEHFAQEICFECNRDLIRIGGSLYTKHDASTCIKRAMKMEEHIESCFTESFAVQNDGQFATPWECDDQAKTKQQNMLDNLSELIDYHNHIPHHQWNELQVQSSIAVAPEQPIPFCEINALVKVEPFDQINAQNLNQINSFSCEICERKTGSKPALQRQKILLHSSGTIFCNVCAKIFTDVAARDVHRIECALKKRLRSSKKSSANIRCDACNTKFKSDAIYRQHMRRKHGVSNSNFKNGMVFKTESASNENNTNQCSDQSVKISGARCDICGKSFNHKSSVYRHKLLLHTPAAVIICNVCGRRFDNGEARDTHRDECALKARLRKSTSSGQSHCNLCLKKFQLDSSLRRHIRVKHDTNVEKFQCAKCSAIFMKEYSLQSHICPKSSEHICDICGRNLSNSRTLQTHKILKHSPSSTIFCSVCAKLYSTVEARDKHKLECSLRKRIQKLKSYGNFECDICHIKVRTKANIRRHIRRMHDPHVDKFRCKTCSFIFINESSLEHHRCKGKWRKVDPEPIPCEICGKILGSKSALRKHQILMHRESDSIFCRTCIKIFPSVTELDAHRPKCNLKKSIHRPCNICGRLLASSSSLRKHKISLHSPPGTSFCRSCTKQFKTADELKIHIPECTLKGKLRKTKI